MRNLGNGHQKKLDTIGKEQFSGVEESYDFSFFAQEGRAVGDDCTHSWIGDLPLIRLLKLFRSDEVFSERSIFSCHFIIYLSPKRALFNPPGPAIAQTNTEPELCSVAFFLSLFSLLELKCSLVAVNSEL